MMDTLIIKDTQRRLDGLIDKLWAEGDGLAAIELEKDRYQMEATYMPEWWRQGVLDCAIHHIVTGDYTRQFNA